MRLFWVNAFQLKWNYSFQNWKSTVFTFSVNQSVNVNVTAEEEVDDEDEDDVPDFKTLRLNTENAHLFMKDADGTSHSSLKKIFAFSPLRLLAFS